MNVLIVYHEGQEKNILSDLKRIFPGCYAVKRDDLQEKDYEKKDIVIVIGGDGTFLRASHLNKDVPMIGINPNPETREGFYAQMDSGNFSEKIKKILDNDFRTADLLRLEVEINGKPLNHAVLNEAFIGDLKPYNVFNYEITVRGKKEFQRGSGVIIGTPSGSSAWIKSAGGELINMEDKRFQFVCRELYEGKHTKDYSIRQGIINGGEQIEILCKSPGIVVIDSRSPETEVKIGDRLVVRAGKNYLKYVKLGK